MSTRIGGDQLREFVLGCAELAPGVFGGLVPHRLPAWARAQVEDLLLTWAEACPTGVLLRFETDSDEVVLTMAATTVAMPGSDGVPPTLVLRQDGRETELVGPAPTVLAFGADRQVSVATSRGPSQVRIPVRPGVASIFLPHNARVELVELSSEGSLRPASSTGVRWTHYGSSISQGMNAVSATRTWPVAAAGALGWDLHNLSFAGNAQLDGFAARLIRSIPADLITLKVGINLLNADSMRERTFRPAAHAFLDTIREVQPDVPIVLISALACPIHEQTPGPVVDGGDGTMHAAHREVEQDLGALTLARTREILAEVVAARADPELSYLDGRELFGLADTELLYDKLHPDQAGLDLIADRFTQRFSTFPQPA